jgi:hypothetical protein
MAVTGTANLDAAEEKVKIIKFGVDLVLDRLMVLGNAIYKNICPFLVLIILHQHFNFFVKK